MMFRTFVALCGLAAFIYAADHNVFKDCAQVDFCENLRDAVPETTYSVDYSSITLDSGMGYVQFTLVPSDNSDNLTVTLCTLIDGSIRIRINEDDSARYQLKDVLVQEPEMIGFIAGYNSEKLVLSSNEGTTNVLINYSPFSIELSKDGITNVVLNGTELVYTNSESRQDFAFAVSFPQAVQLYGIHEHADSLALQTTKTGGTDPYRLRNLDVAGYELNSPMSLYGAVPVLYGHGINSTAGLFLHNAAQQWVETTNGPSVTSARFMVQSGAFDLFLFPGNKPVDVVRQYTALTGTTNLPALWTLGYHQCRWNYESQEDLKDVVANFESHELPLDAIWLDIEYTDAKKYFTWNPENFSDPIEMQQNISAVNKKLVTIIDPHIKVEQGYNVYDGAVSADYFVKNANGSIFEGICWPGMSSYIDFLNPEARSYYASFYSFENFPDTTPVLAGIWNDMNEPSVFDDSLEKTLPDDALHIGNVVHKDIHNIYGLLHTKSTHQGLLERDNGTTRPFILTRSHFAGTQRYAAIWTGDNTADWGYLAISYAECLNANLLGLVFCGADVGGFDGNPDIELLQRWYQAGAWLPFYRAHANLGTDRREPYLFSDEVQFNLRRAMYRRYLHIRSWYTAFFEHSLTGDPVIRPLFYNYPNDENVFNIDNHLILGTDILVRPVTEPGVESVPVYFPGGPDEFWLSDQRFYTDVRRGLGYADIDVTLEEIPNYYRVGSIILINDHIRLNLEDSNEDAEYRFVIMNKLSDEYASSNVYIDDYSSFNYRDNSEYAYMKVEWINSTLYLRLLHDSKADGFTELPIMGAELYTINDLEDNEKVSFKKTKFTVDKEELALASRNLKFNETIAIKLRPE